ncbi:MAG: VOC family protein [Pseudomonadota bacterium]
MTPHGFFHWNELATRDVEAAKTFFAETVGWTFDGMEMENGMYWVAMDGDKPIGGIMGMDGPQFEGVPPHWMSYLSVDDVDARIAKTTANGGEVIVPAFDVPYVGRIAMIKDPTGAALGIITPANPPN